MDYDVKALGEYQDHLYEQEEDGTFVLDEEGNRILTYEAKGDLYKYYNDAYTECFQDLTNRPFFQSLEDSYYFDFIIVDCPAGIEEGFKTAISGASEAIVVTTPEMSAVRDADRIIGLLEAADGIESYKLLLNRVRPNMIKSKDMMSVEDVENILSCQKIGVIPEDTGIITSTNRGEPIVNNEKSLAGKAYMKVARIINGEDVPFLDIDEPKDFVGKLKKFFSGLKKQGKE